MTHEDSWQYLAEKARDLRDQVFLLDGSLVERLKRVEANYLTYLFFLEPKDQELKQEFDEFFKRWRGIQEDNYDEGKVSHFGKDLLSLISRIEKRYWEEKQKAPGQIV